MDNKVNWMLIGLLFPLLLGAGNLKIYSAKPAFEGSKDLTVSTPSAGSTVIDTVKLYDSLTATLRRVRIGKNFNGPNDDTIRVVTVQSASPRRIITLTDTSSGGRFVKFKSTTSSYAFPSGSTPCGLEIGDFDGDNYIDLFAGTTVSPFRFYWFEWNGTNFVQRDSTDVSGAIWNIAYADGDNDGTKEAYFPSGSYLYIVRYNNGLAKDSINFGNEVYVYAIAVGDVNPNLSGNEVYVAGTNLYRVYWNGSEWDVQTIYSGLQTAYSAMVGDVDSTYQGKELVLTHGSTTYQVSVWNWNGSGYDGRAWDFTNSWSNFGDLYIGDVSDKGPVSEVLLVGGSTSATPILFWLDSGGTGYYYPLPEPSYNTTEYGVCAGNINKYNNYRDEFVVTGGGHVLYYHERYIDLALTGLDYEGYILKRGSPANFTVKVKNQGTNPVAGFSITYTHKNHEGYSGSVSIPPNDTIFSSQEKEYSFSINYDFAGTDTLLVYIGGNYGEQNLANDTFRLYVDVWPESTVAASNFPDSTVFPPKGWERISYCVHGYNWEWYEKAVVYGGDITWPEFGEDDSMIIEGFTGVAGFPYWFANPDEGDLGARLITYPFNTGNSRVRLVARFYFLRTNLFWGYESWIIFERIYSNDTVTIDTVSNDLGYNPGDSIRVQWEPFEIVLGDLQENSELKISLYAYHIWWGENAFIDSLWIFKTRPGAIFTFDPQSDYGRIPETDSWWFRIKVSENNYGFLADTLYYQVFDTKEWSGVTHDSVVATAIPADSFYYYTVTIPGASSSTKLRFYFRFIENSRWEYATNYPDTGYIEVIPLGVEVNLPRSYQFSIRGANLSKSQFEFVYALPERSDVEISVYSVTGQKVATLCKGIKDAGYYSVKWNGKSDTGSSLSSGIYIIKMITPKKSFTTRVILTK